MNEVTPKGAKEEGDSGDGTADRLETQRQGTFEQQQGELKHHQTPLDGGVNLPPLESIVSAAYLYSCLRQNPRGSRDIG